MGVIYHGYDILRAEDVASAEECQAVCASHPGCGYFSYAEETRLCDLKHPQALTGRVLSSYHVSGAASCKKYKLGAKKEFSPIFYLRRSRQVLEE